MTQITQMVSEMFMILLCLLSGPADQQEMRIDVLGDQGFMDTLQVQRADGGYRIYDEVNGRQVLYATIKPVSGKPGVYDCTDSKGKTETIDLAAAIQGFNTLDLRKALKETLKTKDKIQIKLNRSGSVTYLKSERMDRTYAVH